MLNGEPNDKTEFLFSKVTCCEWKISLLLIDTFERLFNPENYYHLASILGGHFIFHLLVDIRD